MTLATATAARGAQYALTTAKSFNLTDTLMGTDGVVHSLGGTVGTTTYDSHLVPINSIIREGFLLVEIADNAGGSATVSIGDSTSPTRYLAATSLKTAGPVPFTGLYLDNTPGNNIRIQIINADGSATAGKFTIVANYMIRGRINEAQTT